MKLSANFTLEEALRSNRAIELGVANKATKKQIAIIKYTANRLEEVRALFPNCVIRVSSWFRSKAVNKAVGGVANSDHMSGYSVDFDVVKNGKQLSTAFVVKTIAFADIDFDQLIDEYSKWVHISFAPRRRNQIIHKK